MKNIIFALFVLLSFNAVAGNIEIQESESVTTNVSRTVRGDRIVLDLNWYGKTNDSLQLICVPGKPMTVNYRLNKPESVSRVPKGNDAVILLLSESGYVPGYLKGMTGGEKGDRWIVLADLTQNPEKLARALATSVYDPEGADIVMSFATVKYVGNSDFKITGMSPVINYSSFTDVYNKLKSLDSQLENCNLNAGSVIYNNLSQGS